MLLCDAFATFATHFSLQMKREKKEVSLCHICYTFQPTMESRKSCRMTFLPLLPHIPAYKWRTNFLSVVTYLTLLPHIPALFMTSLTLYCWAQNRSKDGCVFQTLKRKSVIMNRIRSRAKTAHWCAFLWGGGGVAVGVGVPPHSAEGRGGPAPFRCYSCFIIGPSYLFTSVSTLVIPSPEWSYSVVISIQCMQIERKGAYV